MNATAANARAFSAGSDARVAGLPIKRCPFNGKLAAYWRLGWRQADREWGADAHGAARPLPQLAIGRAAR